MPSLPGCSSLLGFSSCSFLCLALALPAVTHASPELATAPPSAAPDLAGFRLGVDGSFGAGLVSALGLGARLEASVTPKGALVLRLGYLRASADGDIANIGLVAFGYRSYTGSAYAGSELQLLTAGQNYILPGAAFIIGKKFGPIDAGITASAPILLIGLTIGVELSGTTQLSGANRPSPATAAPRY